MTDEHFSVSSIDLRAAIIREPLVVSADTAVAIAIAKLNANYPDRDTEPAHPVSQEVSLAPPLPVFADAILVLEDRKVLGILTERDIVRLVSQGADLEHLTMQQVMTGQVITVQESAFTDLFSTLQLLQKHDIRHLPLVDEQRNLAGLLTLTSLQQVVRPLELLRLRLVDEIMNSRIAYATDDLSVVELAQRMTLENLSGLVIVNGSDSQESKPEFGSLAPFGIVTERDLVKSQIGGGNAQSAIARDIMSQPLLTVRPDDSLWDVQQFMEQHRIRRVGVISMTGDLLGMMTQQDLLTALNPSELYNLAEVLEKRVARLEASNIQLLQARTAELERQAEQARLFSELTNQIRASLSLQTMLDTTVMKLRQVLNCDRVNIWQFSPDWSSVAVAESTQSSISLLGERVSDLFIPPSSASNRMDPPNDMTVVHSLDQADLSESHRDWLLRLQAQAHISMPLRCGEQAWGWLQVSETEQARQWTTAEEELLRSLSAQLAISLQQATTHQQLQAELATRRETEEKLRESEERYRIIYDQAVVGFASLDADGQFQDINSSFCQMLGYSREELLGQTPSAITHPEERQSIQQDLQDLFSGKVSLLSKEKRYLRKDGSCFWAQLEVSMARDLAGQPKFTLAMIQDISDRKQAELALQNLIAGTSKTMGKKFFPALVNYIGKALAVEYVLVSELVDDQLRVLAYCQDGVLQPTFEFPLANTPCDQVCTVGRLYIEHCVQQEFPEHLDLVKMQAESYFGISLNRSDGQAIGNLCLLSKHPIQDLKRAEQILQVFAARASVELERQQSEYALEELNKALEEKVEFRTAELKSRENIIRQHAVREKLLRVISQRIRTSLDLEIIFKTACHEVRKVLHADRVGIFQFHLDCDSSIGQFAAESVAKGFTSLLSQEVRENTFCDEYSELYANGRFFATNDIYADNLSECHRQLLADLQVRATLVMPLICDGELWGLFCIHQCQLPRDWHQSDINFAKQLANQLAIAIQQANLFEKLQQELSERQQTQVALTERNLQLAITNEELARATRLKDEFLANMSHELRTPLNAILGMSECLKENLLGEITTKQRNALETVHSSGSHLLSLINEILDLSKIQAGQIKLQLEPVSVAALCDSSLVFVKQQALKKQILLSSTLPDNLSHCFVLDQRRIMQCLINLLMNAVKFTEQGGSVTLAVSCASTSKPQASNSPKCSSSEASNIQYLLTFSVIDTGIGIAQENLDKLFQPFIQIDSALNRKYDGTGLGLALVKRIVELHGGDVSVESQLGQGSTFRFELPCRVVAHPSTLPYVISGDKTADVSTEAASSDLPLILLAEDNEAGINTFQMFLSSRGYRLEVARNGLEAVSIAQAKHPDLILMDIQMPEMDGLEAMRQIRLDPNLTKVPIIALTALAMKGDQERCMAAGANDYLSKPVKLTQLVGVINKLLVEASG